MARKNRQARILELIVLKDIGTQTELAEALNDEGYAVTQATVSRDIKELGLIKVITENKSYKYFLPEKNEKKFRHINLFRESVISIDYAMNMVVIKTIIGAANSACLLIDKMKIPSVMGTLAGDDTIVVIVKTVEDAPNVYKELQEIIQ